MISEWQILIDLKTWGVLFLCGILDQIFHSIWTERVRNLGHALVLLGNWALPLPTLEAKIILGLLSLIFRLGHQCPALTSYLVRIIAVRRFIPKWQASTVYDVKEVWIIEFRAPLRGVREVLHDLELSIAHFKKQLLARFSADKGWSGRNVATLKIMMTIHIIHHIQTALPYSVRIILENYFPVLPSWLFYEALCYLIAQQLHFVFLQLVWACSVDRLITKDIFAVAMWKPGSVWKAQPLIWVDGGLFSTVSRHASEESKNMCSLKLP